MAQIVSIADAFDAMTSTRPYRQGMPIAKALFLIDDALGSQFNMEFGKMFSALRASEHLAHIVGHSGPGLPLHVCIGCEAPIVVRSSQREGEFIYCRRCSGGARLHKQDGLIKLEFTGNHGDASVLAPDSDTDLIGLMVENIAAHVL